VRGAGQPLGGLNVQEIGTPLCENGVQFAPKSRPRGLPRLIAVCSSSDVPMCRFLVYKGRYGRPCALVEMLILCCQASDSRVRPDHAASAFNHKGRIFLFLAFVDIWFLQQSYDSRLRVDDARPLNGDGFGVGWYDPNDAGDHANNKSSTPCVFTSVMPAWNNPNLLRLAEKIQSHLVFAHVRAASSDTPVSETNCHPWQYGNFLWMHNGFVSGFTKIKRRLRESLTDELYQLISGNTDSESAFAVFLNQA